MPRPPDTTALEEARSFWTGLDPRDLRALRRAPLDPAAGFTLAERVADSAEAPAVAVVRAIAHVLGTEGAPVGADGSFGAATVQGVDAFMAGAMPEARSEDDAPYVRAGRQLAEAAGLIERRKGRARLTDAGRRLVDDDADALLPHLFRAWARRPLGRSSRFDDALHATWPLTILLLRRFGEEWRPAAFYAVVVAEIAPEAVAAAPALADDGGSTDDPREPFAHAYVLDVLLRFAAFFGLIELSNPEDEDAQPTVCATEFLYELLEPAVEPAPASDAIDDADEPEEDGVSPIHGDLTTALAERSFASEEELHAFVDAFMADRNAAPLDEFDGLSPASMHALLHDPFGDASPLVVADVPRVVPRSKLLHLVLDLAAALGDAGLKATVAGNLPRAYVLAALERYEAAGWGAESYVHVRGEQDFGDLHVARIVARMAGLVTLRRGRWHATKAYRTTLARSGVAGVYATLFRTVTTKYAWRSTDGYPELHIMQASWGFSLLQLLRHGGTWRDGTFYVERFAHAFPMAFDEVADDSIAHGWITPPEVRLAYAYEIRVLERFAAFLGLAEIEAGTTLEDFGRVRRVRATPGLGEVVAERVG